MHSSCLFCGENGLRRLSAPSEQTYPKSSTVIIHYMRPAPKGIHLIWPKTKTLETKSLWESRWPGSFISLNFIRHGEQRWFLTAPWSWFQSWARLMFCMEFLYSFSFTHTHFLHSLDMSLHLVEIVIVQLRLAPVSHLRPKPSHNSSMSAQLGHSQVD